MMRHLNILNYFSFGMDPSGSELFMFSRDLLTALTETFITQSPGQSIKFKVNRLGTWSLSKIKGKSKISVRTCGFHLKSLTDKNF